MTLRVQVVASSISYQETPYQVTPLVMVWVLVVVMFALRSQDQHAVWSVFDGLDRLNGRVILDRTEKIP